MLGIMDAHNCAARKCLKRVDTVSPASPIGQVRFKDEFYGHSAGVRTRQASSATRPPVDAVAEWQALQSVAPPILLADHLTWLRVHGTSNDPRLLATVADRPSSSPFFPAGRQRNRPHDHRAAKEKERGAFCPGGHDGGGRGEHQSIPCDFKANSCGGGGGGNSSRGESGIAPVPATTPSFGGDAFKWCAEPPVPSIVPLKPFLQLVEEIRKNSSTTFVQGKTGGQSHAGDPTQARSSLTHDVHTSLKEYGLGGEIIRNPEARAGPRKNCELFHLVVDGVVFQVDAAKLAGIWRVWAKVLPAVRK